MTRTSENSLLVAAEVPVARCGGSHRSPRFSLPTSSASHGRDSWGSFKESERRRSPGLCRVGHAAAEEAAKFTELTPAADLSLCSVGPCLEGSGQASIRYTLRSPRGVSEAGSDSLEKKCSSVCSHLCRVWHYLLGGNVCLCRAIRQLPFADGYTPAPEAAGAANAAAAAGGGGHACLSRSEH